MSDATADALVATLSDVVRSTLPLDVLLESAANDELPGKDQLAGIVDLGWNGLWAFVGDDAPGAAVAADMFEVLGRGLVPSLLRDQAAVLAPLLSIAAERGDAGASVALRRLLAGAIAGGGVVVLPPGERFLEMNGDGTGRVTLEDALVTVGPDRSFAFVLNATGAALIEVPGEVSQAVTLELGQGTCRLSGTFDVPAPRVFSPEEGRGSWHRWHLAVMSELVGCASEILERSVTHARTREQFGRALSRFQAVEHLLADMAVRVETARSAQARLVLLIQDETQGDIEAYLATLRHSLPVLVRSACENAIQIHGGTGYSWEQGLHLWYRRVLQRQALFGGEVATASLLGEQALRRLSVGGSR